MPVVACQPRGGLVRTEVRENPRMKMIEKRMEQRGQGGFTLIELLVVIAILAVLGGAVIIGIGAMRGNAEEQVCKTNKETLELAVEAFRVSENRDPADVEELESKGYVKTGTLNGWSLNAAKQPVHAEFDANCDPVTP